MTNTEPQTTTNPSEYSEPGTLVWVGPTNHLEFREAFQFCQYNAAQLAVRRDVAELVSRPAGFVQRIIFAREDRSPISNVCYQSLAHRYRDAQWVALTSSLCDGEPRTGTPWPGIKHVRFSRWKEFFGDWLEPCGYVRLQTKLAKSVLFLADRFETAEPYLDAASSIGVPITWKRTYLTLTDRNVERLFWDESVAKPTSIVQWQRRLQASPQQRVAEATVQHVWLTTSPRAAEISDAIQGGVSNVYCKPIMHSSLLEMFVSTRQGVS